MRLLDENTLNKANLDFSKAFGKFFSDSSVSNMVKYRQFYDIVKRG
jgi:hypothetical protein